MKRQCFSGLISVLFSRTTIITTLFVFGISLLNAQQTIIVTALVSEAETNEPIPFVNAVVYNYSGEQFVGGTAGNAAGEINLTINNGHSNSYLMQLSALGYESIKIYIEPDEYFHAHLGTINLQPGIFQIEGIEVVGERVRATSGSESIIFNVNKNMQHASLTGVDILKLVPGLQVDLRQNISLNGSSNILILVNGIERDQQYVQQLRATQIDKIEIMNTPPARYDATVTGVVNIVLKSEPDSGVEGQVVAEIPTRASEVYLFPTYSLNYGKGRLNLYTSYNGELSYFNVEERVQRKIFNNEGTNEIMTVQNNKQQYWSHRFHYGLDFYLNSRNQFNVYANYNPFSNEHSGNTYMRTTTNNTVWEADKNDSDLHSSSFYSLYYKHLFSGNAGHELSVDGSFYRLNGESHTIYTNNETGNIHENISKPQQNMSSLRADYNLPISQDLFLSAGMQTKTRMLNDEHNVDFAYINRIMSAYGTFKFSASGFDAQSALRYENSLMGETDGQYKQSGFFLPNFTANYKYSQRGNLNFTYRRALSYPQLHQLNNAVAMSDPYSIEIGNPGLETETIDQMRLEYSRRFSTSFASASVFYNNYQNAIRRFTHINESGIFETRHNNMGNIRQYGMQFAGSISISSKMGISPYFKFFGVQSSPGNFDSGNLLSSRNSVAYEAGFSAYAVLGRGFMATAILQYASPVFQAQAFEYMGPLYFLSLEKSFAQNLKASLVCAVPFAGSVVYQASLIENEQFYSHSEGRIMMSEVPIWFRLSYNFSAGAKRNKIDREKEKVDPVNRRGF